MRLISISLLMAAAAASHAIVLSSWNFNDSSMGASTLGSGVLSATLATDFPAVQYYAGSTANALPGEPAGMALGVQNGSGGANNGRWLEMHLMHESPLTALALSFASERTSTGFSQNTLSYSLDGQTFTDVANYSPATSWSTQTFDLASVPSAAELFLRITFMGGSTTSTTGNNKIDNLILRGEPVPEPASISLLACGAAGLIFRKRRHAS
jgi:hypothetical protein